MKKNLIWLLAGLGVLLTFAGAQASEPDEEHHAGSMLSIPLSIAADGHNQAGDRLTLDDFYYQTASGRNLLPETLTANLHPDENSDRHLRMPDGRMVRLSLKRQASDFLVSLSAEPNTNIMGWGFGAQCGPDEYYTGLMERLVDVPNKRPGLQVARKP